MGAYVQGAQSVFAKLAIGEQPFQERNFDLSEQEQNVLSEVAVALKDLIADLEDVSPANGTSPFGRIVQFRELTIICNCKYKPCFEFKFNLINIY